MPLIVRYPGSIKAGTVNEELVSNVDFAPTLLEFAGIKADPRMQGRSIAPLLGGSTPADWRQAIWYAYGAAGHPHWGMRSKRYKLVLFPGTEDFEFYDLQKDPREMTNLAGVTDYAAAIAAARKTVEALKLEVGILPGQLPGKAGWARAGAGERKRKKKNRKQESN